MITATNLYRIILVLETYGESRTRTNGAEAQTSSGYSVWISMSSTLSPVVASIVNTLPTPGA